MGQLTNGHVLNEIQDQFGNAVLGSEEPNGLLTLNFNPEKLLDLVKFLYNHETLRFRFLTDICGAHFPEQKGGELASIYHLHSLENNIRIRIKCFLPSDHPFIDSITSVFSAADWQERETYDFYGIIYNGHANLKRILNVDEMDYHPLRKEYPLEDQTRTDKNDSYFGR